MDTREKMREWREATHASYDMISKKIGVSSGLIGMVENGCVTHPKIVEKLQNFYGLTDIEAEELLPKNRRPSDPDYDPDRYVSEAEKQLYFLNGR